MKLVFVPYSDRYINELVRIHRISHKDHFNSRLGNNYAKNLIKWFAEEKEYQGILLVAVDTDNDSVAGYICGAKDNFGVKQNKDLLKTIILAFITRPYLIFSRKFWELFKLKIRSFSGKEESPQFIPFKRTLPEPIFSVNVFALSPELREKGFGYFLLDKLMEEFFKAAKEKGAKTVGGTIWADNKNILAYYKLKKWIEAPHDEKDSRMEFYKIL